MDPVRLVLLPIHIVAGGLAIVLGAVALSAAKGATVHRKAGLSFVAAMLAMGGTGAVLALRHGLDPNALGGFMSIYLVTTALTTVRTPAVGARPLEVGAMLLAFTLGLVNLIVGIIALRSPHLSVQGVPFVAFFIFALVGLLAGAGDLRVLRSGALRGAARLRRHLWRMCLAMFIATASFFSIRSRVAKILPEPFLGPGMRTLPIVLVLGAMVYWLWRVRGRRASRAMARMGVPQST